MMKNENNDTEELKEAEEQLNILKHQLKNIQKELKTEKARQKKRNRSAGHEKKSGPRVDDDYLAYRRGRRKEEIAWRKLDTTALMYPIISGEGFSNVYRISVTLTEPVDPEQLQQALNTILPKFSLFNTRLRRGVFWYYLEENGQPAPHVRREDSFPCQYINAEQNRNYLFRVTYFRRRINLEVFHVLTDGMGAMTFLKELVYQYLRNMHSELGRLGDHLSSNTSLNIEDSFSANSRKMPLRMYHFQKAYLLHEARFPAGKTGIVRGTLPLNELKTAARKYGASVNEFLVALLTFSIYEEEKGRIDYKKPIVVCVPVNLRPYYDSITTNNFFTNVSAVFQPESSSHTFEEVLKAVQDSLHEQINQDHLNDQFSKNVSTANNIFSRMTPMAFKRIAMKLAYNKSAQGITTTLSNLGSVDIDIEYQPFIEKFSGVLAESKGQGLKVLVVSYRNQLVITISSIFRETNIQKHFFRFLTGNDVSVYLETNGIYYR